MNKVIPLSKFAIADVLSIDENAHGLTRLKISTAHCQAKIYLQGAHLCRWQPNGQEEVLFLSENSTFQPEKAIRGGIPIIFPWFGQRTATACSQRTAGPAHGFARTSIWKISAAALYGDDLDLTLFLVADNNTRALGWDNFELTYRLIIGKSLQLLLTVENKSETPIVFEEAFHTYFRVADVEKIAIGGLARTQYLDKTDSFKRKEQSEELLSLVGETDRPYLNTEAPVYIDDPLMTRRLAVEKENSNTTVVWNPWSSLAEKMADMHSGGWKQMTCIETANVGENAINLGPGQRHTMQALITVESSLQ